MIESLEDDLALEFAVVGHAEVVPHHEGHEHRARRLTVLCDVQSDGDGNCGNTSVFNSALHERDRLVSYRSSGSEQRDIGTICHNSLRNILSERALQSLRVHVVTDEGEEVRRQTTYYAF